MQVAAGSDHSLAVSTDGTVWAWGNNSQGQLGDRTTLDRSAPVAVVGLRDVAAVAAGGGFSLALKTDGSVWAWGDNSQGQLADGTLAQRSTPQPVKGPANAVAMAASSDHTVILDADGTIWAWGDNSFGGLGDGTTNQRLAAIQVPGLSGVIGVAAGLGYSLALNGDGSVWAWGLNAFGQLGDGTTTSRAAPALVVGLTDAVSIAAGTGHALAVDRDGNVWAWGDNSEGQLGDGTTKNRAVPGPVTGLPGIATVEAGASYSLAISSSTAGQRTSLQGSSRLAWASAFVANIGAQTPIALQFVLAWEQVEGAAAIQNNPLNSTRDEPGAVSLPGSSAGVKVYPTLDIGLQANLDTILQARPALGYGPVLIALQAGEVTEAAVALQASRWCYDSAGPAGHQCPGYAHRILSIALSYRNPTVFERAGAVPAGSGILTGGATYDEAGGAAVSAAVAPRQLPGTARALATALAQLGKPYVWGGKGPDVFDCSGLMVWSWAAVGIHLPRVAADQQAWATPIGMSELQPGDLVFYGLPAYHVGMYLGRGLMINAPYPGADVDIVPLWNSGLAGFGRAHR